MTWFLRNAFLALVAFATLAIIVMMAMTAEAKGSSTPKRSPRQCRDTRRWAALRQGASPLGPFSLRVSG